MGATLPRGPRRRGARAGLAGDRRRRTRRTGTPTARARLKHPGRRPGLAGRAARTGPAGEPSASPASLPAPPRPWSRPRRTCQGLGAHIAGPGHFPPPEPGPFRLSPPPAPQPAPPAPGNASRCRPLKLTVLPRVRRRESGVRMRGSCSRRDLGRVPLGIPRLRSPARCRSISFRDFRNVDPSQPA